MFYTYVLLSQKEVKLYIGFSETIEKRIAEHNGGEVAATQGRKPLKLLYYEACESKFDAIQREKYLKSGFGQAFPERSTGKLL